MKKKTTTPAMSDAAKSARARYYRELRQRDPDAAKERERRYWEKKALEYAAQDAKEARTNA